MIQLINKQRVNCIQTVSELWAKRQK